MQQGSPQVLHAGSNGMTETVGIAYGRKGMWMIFNEIGR